MIRRPPRSTLFPTRRSSDLNEMAKVLVEGATHIRSAVGELLAHPGVASEHAVRGKRSENRVDGPYHPAGGRPFGSGVQGSLILKARALGPPSNNTADRLNRPP